MLIAGTNYWAYDTPLLSTSQIEIKPNFPKPLSNLGLPNDVTIVAALSNRDQNRIYLFTEDMFWSFDGNLGSLNAASPEMTSGRWPGIPNGFDAAFSWQGTLNHNILMGCYFICMSLFPFRISVTFIHVLYINNQYFSKQTILFYSVLYNGKTRQ